MRTRETAKIIAFPSSNDASEFNEDDIQELTWRLQIGNHGGEFTDAELDFIASWGGDGTNSDVFRDARIIRAYGIEPEPGSELSERGEPCEYTWPKLAAMLRQQKVKPGTNTTR